MLRKKNIFLYTLFLILVVVAGYFYYSQQPGTLKVSETGFMINDTASISSVVVYNQVDTVVLTKDANQWLVNNSYRANAGMIQLCMQAFSGIEIQSALSGELAKLVEQQILENGALLEVTFSNKKPVLFYYFPDRGRKQVYAMMKNSKTPYVVSIPSYQGNFAGLFYAHHREWRDKLLLQSPIADIVEVNVDYYANETLSYTVDLSQPGNPIVFTQINKNGRTISKEAANAYLMSFKPFRAVEFLYSENTIDSLKAQKKSASMQIQFSENKKIQFDMFPYGTPASLHKAFCLINNTELAIVNYSATDPLFRAIDYLEK